MSYRILWDNGHASGELAGDYKSRRAALIAARAWKRDMVAVDQDPAQARRDYQWEIIDTTDRGA